MIIVPYEGVGKSDLAVEIANCVHGEVINADAMQLYQVAASKIV